MRIKTIKIENFKGIKHLEIALNGKNATINGKNGSGKTTIADAISWCLFGKSSNNASDFGIRPVGGDRDADSQVRIETTDGTNILRGLHEKWVKQKGTAEVKYKGTETVCEWNDVPLSVTDFKRKVTEMFPVGDEVFKLCTQPLAFLSLNWQAQKEILLGIVGKPSEEEIGMNDFLKELNGKSLDEFKAGISKQKRPIMDEFKAIPARIDEADRLRKTATEADKEALEAVTAKLENLRNAGAGVEGIKAKSAEIRRQVSEKQSARQTKVQATNSAKLQANMEVTELSARIERNNVRIAELNSIANTTEASLMKLRKDYDEVYARRFESDGICPVCKQPYPQEQMQEMQEKFNSQRAEELKAINEKGQAMKANKEDNLKKADDLVKENADLQKALESKKAAIAAMSEADTTEEDNAIKALMEEEAELLRQYGQVDNSQQIKELEAERARLLNLVNVEDFNRDIDQRIETLRDKQKTLGDELARLESLEYEAKEYAKRIVDLVESKINAKFNTLRFKFTQPTIEGGYTDTCVATVNGVEFKDINTASQINAGIEIINVLSEHYKVEAPLIIDNRERVTEILPCRQQTISLAVCPTAEKLEININD